MLILRFNKWGRSDIWRCCRCRLRCLWRCCRRSSFCENPNLIKTDEHIRKRNLSLSPLSVPSPPLSFRLLPHSFADAADDEEGVMLGCRLYCRVPGSPAKNATLFLSFPYVCPEPVLVKRFVFIYKCLKKRRFSHRRCRPAGRHARTEPRAAWEKNRRKQQQQPPVSQCFILSSLEFVCPEPASANHWELISETRERIAQKGLRCFISCRTWHVRENGLLFEFSLCLS